jgi:hypothetical protein
MSGIGRGGDVGGGALSADGIPRVVRGHKNTGGADT